MKTIRNQPNIKPDDSFNKYEDKLNISDLDDVACFQNHDELAATSEKLIKQKIAE